MDTDALIELLRGSAPHRTAGARLHVAFSGGLDSTVLLHALVDAGFQDLVAVHVHHGLQAAADDWVLHCGSICAGLNVPLRVLRVQVRADGRGIEAAARAARYAAFHADLRAGEVLVTAHHQGDQVETVLLNLMRGSGPGGLSAMASLREFGAGWLWRPFLPRSRDALRRYAERFHLRWIEDPHNRDPRFVRSFLRAEILPRLEQRWPEFGENLARSATLAAESAALLRELANSDIGALTDRGDGSLPVAEVLALSSERRRNLVRFWVESLGLAPPGHAALQHLDREVLSADRDAAPVLAWPGGEFRRHRDRLFAMPVLPPVPEGFRTEWDGCSVLALPEGCGELRAARTVAGSAPPWTVRMARPADRFRRGRGGRNRTLKNLFQEGGVPTWVRERTPLLVADDRPVWIGGFGWAEDGEADVSCARHIEWRGRPPGAPAAD
jgi:tRNA(Ile)-lysidine synthase